MRIAILQFSPQLGQVSSNIDRANVLLRQNAPGVIDVLILPELAFPGYNHTLASIHPLLEPTCAGPSTIWAHQTAAKYRCLVSVGYPELLTLPASREVVDKGGTEDSVAYNSTVTMSPDGEVLAHYRKTHLYYTDEGWATEGPEGWLIQALPLQDHNEKVKAAFGICMDLNPYKFTAPWDAYEFCISAINTQADMLVLSMAWLSSLPAAELKETPETPDMDTFTYWLNRLLPLLETEKEVLVVCANRAGEEPGNNPCGQVEEGVRYAGTSWVGRVGKGKVDVWGMLGRGEEGILVVDTEEKPKASFEMLTKAK
ncbi:MAG: hypothetical protein Q9217_002639 [Psora testacea]